MIDTLKIFEELKEEFSEAAARKLAHLMSKLYNELANVVTKEDFREFKAVVAELAEAQKQSEQRLSRLEQTVAELAEAQKQSEQRLSRLEQTVAELAEAQKRTEQRVEELAQAQKETQREVARLDKALSELAQAQKEMAKEIQTLTKEYKKTREQLGGLSHTIGYILEDRAYKGLPLLLQKDFGIEIFEPLKRDYIEIREGEFIEVNIIGKGKKNGQNIWIIGDCKSQLKKSDVDSFVNLVKKISSLIAGEKFLVVITYQASPVVQQYVRQNGIKLYFSYELPL